jgi:hypothetical protein
MASTSGSSSAVRSSASRRRRVAALSVAAALAVVAAGAVRAGAPRYFPDDPLWTDADTAIDAAKVAPVEDAGSYDFAVNTFALPGERRSVRALNVNTIDEVPDSSWFTNRIGRSDLRPPTPLATLRRGPDRLEAAAPLSLEGWTVSAGKSTGVQPGFRMIDPGGQLYQIEIDPPSNPEMATGAEIIGTAFYYAFGYHTVEVYLAELDPGKLVISKKAAVFDPLIGRKRPLTRRDIDNVLRRGARRADGKYRVLASRFAEGRPLGNFRYHGTRSDDPNDIVPHEHRRELRAARVFGAWLNHDDSRAVNSLDMLVSSGGRAYVKHYMFDFGSTLGSGTVYEQRHRPGNEYIFEWAPGWKTLATLGLYVRPWMLIDYPRTPPSIGRFEADAFSPAAWKPEYPNPAFTNMRGDDAFWAARIVGRFSNEAIRAIVEKAQYSDPRATDYMTEALIKRRDKVVAHWLTAVNPLVDFALSDAGELTFGNAAEQAQAAPPAERYRVQWARFDNAAGAATDVGDALTVEAPRAMAPAALVAAARPGDYLEARVAALHPRFSAWATPVTVHFRREASGWTLVGLSRLPD